MLVQWNPWTRLNELARLEQVMNQFDESRPAASRTSERAAPAFAPAVDIHETAEQILLVADLPGVEEKDLEISINKNVLTIRGERKLDVAAGKDAHHRSERVHGAFARSFTLPPSVDTENVVADLKQGVLKLTLTKKAEAKPRQIKVQVSA